MKLFFAGATDFTVTTTDIQIVPGQQQQDVVFTLEPDNVAQEPNETFRIVATVDAGQIRPLEPNEFIRRTKLVTIIDRTSKQQ